MVRMAQMGRATRFATSRVEFVTSLEEERTAMLGGTSLKITVAAAAGALMMAGALAGCGSLSSDHVDCNVVKLQSESGRSDAEIASAIGASVNDVAKCHGPETSGNKESGGEPSPY